MAVAERPYIRATAHLVWTQMTPRQAMYWPTRTGPWHSRQALSWRALRALWARIIRPPSGNPYRGGCGEPCFPGEGVGVRVATG